ncbi:hypothetical protein FIBSPDRAFT_871298, partial [Athelia psychrophila]
MQILSDTGGGPAVFLDILASGVALKDVTTSTVNRYRHRCIPPRDALAAHPVGHIRPVGQARLRDHQLTDGGVHYHGQQDRSFRRGGEL